MVPPPSWKPNPCLTNAFDAGLATVRHDNAALQSRVSEAGSRASEAEAQVEQLKEQLKQQANQLAAQLQVAGLQALHVQQ